MRYTPKQYATTLLAALHRKSTEERRQIIANFAAVLHRHRMWAQRKRVLAEVEKLAVRQSGLHKLLVSSAAPLDPKIQQELSHIFHDKVLMATRVIPDLLAGITILLDDELLIDASGRTGLAILLKRHQTS
ncbi:MAG: F0F1 ATP synthase subunit delta [Candidatus Sungbacteria bacterium]|nr:F0F1 ATP synthase subunit delta [Candidatus Sungbacteria bacterium]